MARSASLVPAIDRAISVMALLESAPQQSFSLAEIARRLDLPKSTTLNICNSLVLGLFLRRSQGGYQLGRRLVQLGSAYVSSVDIIREFYEVSRLVEPKAEVMIQLAVLDEQLNAVYLARQDCNSGLRLGLRAEIGRRVPANCTAAGKALLAALPASDLGMRLGGLQELPSLTKKSISSPSQLQAELGAIRTRGYSTEDEEALPGVVCIARAANTSHREDGLLAVSITIAKAALNATRRRKLQIVLAMLVKELEFRL